MATTKVILGSEIKLNLYIEPIGDISLNDYDFNVSLYCSPSKIITYKKEDTKEVVEDPNSRILPIDTNKLGVGRIMAKVTAYLPDGDFDDNLRTEIVFIDTDIEIKKQ